MTLSGAVGWLLEHGDTAHWWLVGVFALIVAGRVGWLLTVAWTDLRLRHRAGDAAGAVADWLGALPKGKLPGERHSSLYANYLQSPAWAARRERTLLLAGGVCQQCGRRRATDAHHLTYARLGAERDADLIAVCKGCHQQTHGR